MSNSFQYFAIKTIEKAPKVQLKSIESFISLTQLKENQLIFVNSEAPAEQKEQSASLSEDIINRTRQFTNNIGVTSNKTQSQFSFLSDGIAFCVDALGFQTIEEYKTAKDLGFNNGDDYRHAQKLKFENAEAYIAFKENGFTTKETFITAQSKGFTGAKKSLSILENALTDEAKTSIKNLKNDAEIYQLASIKNYTDFASYVEAVKLGFAQHDAADYKLAVENGFSSAKQYYNARNKGFETAEESKTAAALKLDNKFELDLFKQLNETKDNFNFAFHDQAHIFKILNDLEAKVSLDLIQINDIFQSEQDKLKFQAPASPGKGAEWLSNSLNKLLKPNSMPDWYKIGFKTKEEIKTFLISNEKVAKIGKFDISNEIFTKK